MGRPGKRSDDGWLRRWFGGVSERMLAIILMATLPMAALSAITAWQNFGVVRTHNIAHARQIRDHFSERGRLQIEVATNILQRLAERPDVIAAGRCAEVLRFVVSLELLRSTRLSILGADHDVLCSQASRGMSADPGLGHVPVPSPGQLVIVPADVQPLTLDIVSRPAGTEAPPLLVAQIEAGWWRATGPQILRDTFGDVADARLWLRFADGQIRAFCTDCGWPAPAAALWPAHAGGRVEGLDGQSYYASGPVADGVDVLVVTPPGSSDARAFEAFFVRVIEIVLILGAALLLVVVAANLAIVAPIDELTRAVDRWRRGGPFQRARIALMPTELRNLWEAFAAATETLSRHEAGLAAAEIRQGLLIKEIHHRVKNNLQIIASLLNLQANRIKQPDSKAEFASARDRVRALATLHRHLYQEGEPEAMGLRGFIEELCAQLFQAMGERPNGRIRLEIAVQEVELPPDQAVPIALIVTEATSNAVKYAFPGGRSGRIAVRLAEQAPDSLLLVIEDDGIGIPEGRVETESGVRDGLGLQLIRGFARQLGATLEVVQGPGTTYTVTIPRHVTSHGVRL